MLSKAQKPQPFGRCNSSSLKPSSTIWFDGFFIFGRDIDNITLNDILFVIYLKTGLLMSRLSDLAVAAYDRLLPPSYPKLGSRQFFDDRPGIWVRKDFTNRCKWGYAGIRIVMDELDLHERMEQFVTTVSHSLGACSIHAGLASWPLPVESFEEWHAAQSASPSPLISELRHFRKEWLAGLGLRERLSYVIVRVWLGADESAHLARVSEALEELMGISRAFAFGERALSHEEMLRIDVEPQAEPEPPRNAEYILRNASVPVEYAAVTQTLADIESQVTGAYRATLDIVPEGHLKVSAQARLRTQLSEHGRQLVLSELARRGVAARPVCPRKQSFVPLEREVSRWGVDTPAALPALTPLAVTPGGTSPARGGMPLKSVAGEFRAFSPFLGGVSANTAVVGGGDVNSHAVACELIVSQLASGNMACVVDESGVFREFATALGGSVVKLGQDGPLGLDLLQAVRHEDELYDVDLPSWLVALAGKGNDSAYRMRAAEALYELWTMRDHVGGFNLATAHGLLSRADDPRTAAIAKGLEPYVGAGEYASLFTGEPYQAGDNPLTVLDLTAWKESPARAHVLQAVIRLQHRAYTSRDFRSKSKLFMLAESLALHAYGENLEFWLRTCRKYGIGAFVLARPQDLEAGKPLQQLAGMFRNWLLLSLSTQAADALHQPLRLTTAHFWQLGWPALNDDTSNRSMTGTIRLLLASGREVNVFDFRPDPGSRALYALPQKQTEDEEPTL